MRPVRGLLGIAVWALTPGAASASEAIPLRSHREGNGETVGSLGVYVYRMPQEERILKARADEKGRRAYLEAKAAERERIRFE